MISNFKQPDLNAPRYREKVYSFLNKETFNEFKEKYPAYSNIDNEKLRSIIKIFNTRIWNAAIDNRDGIELPKSLGYLFIGTCKPPKSVNMDYALSKKYGKALQNENWETDGHLGKIFYTNYSSKYKFKNRDLWRFQGHRDFKRTVAKKYPENWTMYMNMIDKSRVSHLYYRQDEKCAEDLKTYNEFEF